MRDDCSPSRPCELARREDPDNPSIENRIALSSGVGASNKRRASTPANGRAFKVGVSKFSTASAAAAQKSVHTSLVDAQ
jgi:hypothetical protein